MQPHQVRQALLDGLLTPHAHQRQALRQEAIDAGRRSGHGHSRPLDGGGETKKNGARLGPVSVPFSVQSGDYGWIVKARLVETVPRPRGLLVSTVTKAM